MSATKTNRSCGFPIFRIRSHDWHAIEVGQEPCRSGQVVYPGFHVNLTEFKVNLERVLEGALRDRVG